MGVPLHVNLLQGYVMDCPCKGTFFRVVDKKGGVSASFKICSLN